MKAKLLPEILGIGLAVPAHSLKQSALAEHSLAISKYTKKNPALVRVLYQKTRIEKRGSVLFKPDTNKNLVQEIFWPQKNNADKGPDTRQRMRLFKENAPLLALAAARAALDQAAVKARDISHLIVVTCTGFSAPGLDWNLIRGLRLSPETARTQIGFMGCHGLLNGLRVAQAFAQANKKNKILLVSVEIASIHYSYELSNSAMIANALFADGSAACVIGAADGAKTSWLLNNTGSFLFPDSASAMSWEIGNHGFEMTLSPQVPKLIEDHLKKWLESWLAKQHLKIKDIGSWAVHPGGPRVLDAVEKGLGLAADTLKVSRRVLTEHGNMSSATILFILDQLKRRHAPRPCLVLGFGPGLVVEAALIS